MVNVSRILKFWTLHGFDKFGWNDPNRKYPVLVLPISEDWVESGIPNLARMSLRKYY